MFEAKNTHYTEGNRYFWQDSYEKAIHHFEIFINEHQKNYQDDILCMLTAYYKLAFSYREIENIEKAKENTEKALSILTENTDDCKKAFTDLIKNWKKTLHELMDKLS